MSPGGTANPTHDQLLYSILCVDKAHEDEDEEDETSCDILTIRVSTADLNREQA